MPVAYAYTLWDHKELIPRWMPIIASVQARTPSPLPHAAPATCNGPRSVWARTRTVTFTWDTTVVRLRRVPVPAACSIDAVPSVLHLHAAQRCPVIMTTQSVSMHCERVRVQVPEEDKDMSTWTLRADKFGREWKLVWLARNRAPIRCA